MAELTGGFDIVKGERVKIHGYLEDFALSKDEADGLIMSAREIVYKDWECRWLSIFVASFQVKPSWS